MSILKYVIVPCVILVLLPSVHPNTAFGETIFQEEFESGNLGRWVNYWPTDVRINSDPKFVHSGNYSLRIHYKIPPTGAAHRDKNRFILKAFSDGFEHIFVSGYVYLGTPLNNDSVQRKLYYLKDPKGPGGNPDNNWHILLTTFDYTLAVSLSAVPKDSAFQEGDRKVIWDLFTLQANRWYTIDFQVKANTPGKRDGTVRVSVDDAEVLNATNLNIRGNFTTKITRVEIGRQVDRLNSIPVDEYRYWDDIVIIDAGSVRDTKPPTAPTGVRIQ